MICDGCGRDNAVIKLVVMSEGRRVEQHLCVDCMREKQKDSIRAAKMVFEALLGRKDAGLPEGGSNEEKNEKPEDAVRCACGTSFSEIQKTARVGCPRCYEFFRDKLTEMMTVYAGSAQHAGSAPEQADGQSRSRLAVEELNRKLNEAVELEEYERAAEIRDELRALMARASEGDRE